MASLGWTPFFEAQVNDSELEEGLVPARLSEEQRGHYRLLGQGGAWHAELSGRLRHEAESGAAELPCVGDWVMAHLSGPREDDLALIVRVLKRRTGFSRRAPGDRVAEQMIASNVDTVFLLQSLNADLNPRRLERYLARLWESGAQPVVVLSKADLCPDPDPALRSVESAALGAPVLLASAVEPGGLEALEPYLEFGQTVALVGSSGVGKSTLVNRLAGREILRTQEIRARDDRGRHTTTARQLVPLPCGALLLDTPGMRTVLLWEGGAGLARVFEDIELLAAKCRFRDCTHADEPGCAVREAFQEGALDPGRLASYEKLRREERHVAMKSDIRLRQEEKRRWRRIHLEQRRRPDRRRI